MGGLLIAKGKAIATDLEGDRIAQWSSSQNFDRCPIAESHFQQPPADFGGAADFDDLAAAPDAQLVEGTRGRAADVRASSEVTSLFHKGSPNGHGRGGIGLYHRMVF